MTDWSEYQDDISDAISESVDIDWNANDGARSVVRWLNENVSMTASAKDALALRTMLDNLVIAQGLSKEIREHATDAARSYLYNTRAMLAAAPAAAPAAPQAAGVGEERDYPAEFEAWWATYRHRNRNVANYPVKKQIAFDAFYYASLRAPSREPEGGAVLDARGVYLRDNLDVVLRAVEDMARIGIEVAKQGDDYRTEDRDRARIDFIAEVCRRWAALATREKAPAEAGENDDDASTYQPSIAGLSDYLWNQALAADSVESRCILEMWREAVDSNAQTGQGAK